MTKQRRINKKKLLAFMGAFAVVGILAVLLTKALVPTASVEPENGTVAAPAQIKPSPAASGGSFVQFGAANGNLVPATGALLGAHQSPSSLQAQREATFGRKYDISHRYKTWSNGTIGLSEAQTDLAAGRIPMISWDGPTLSTVTDGTYDAAIHASANQVKALSGPIFIRWCWEMNITIGQGKGPCGFDDTVPKAVAGANFVAAWRHIYDIFAAEGANAKVDWVWCVDNQGGDGPQRWDVLYPGDNYVDWICDDSYNKDLASWQSFAAKFQYFYTKYVPTGKPLMVGETSSADGDPATSQNKAQWITDMSTTLKTNYTGMKAVLWFDENKQTNWLIDSLSSPSSLAAFTGMARDCYFNTRQTYPGCN